uniref:Uncharacterized protein n=1 Tax=Arundo donax TaxID=35708 RepID=A0A0A8XX05_ARUDO
MPLVFIVKIMIITACLTNKQPQKLN